MKIIVLALSGIGDALMFTPAISFLCKNEPEAQIDVLVMYKGAAEIFDGNPNISSILFFDFINEGAAKSLKFISSIRHKYDAAINVYPSNRKEYNLVNFLVGAKQRAAVKYLRYDFKNLGFLNNVRVLENDGTHNVQTNIKLCETLLNKKSGEDLPLEIFLSEKENSFAQKFFSDFEISNDDLTIGFHPGCATLKNHIRRRWEPEKFAALAKALIDNYRAKILVFGGTDESDLKEKVLNQINSPHAFSVKTGSILDSAAVMKRCNIFVTNDSSQMHIASALQLNVVAIIGPTNKNYIHPWKTNHKIVSLNLDCAPCFFYSPQPLTCSRKDVEFKCIKELTVDIVYDAVKSFL